MVERSTKSIAALKDIPGIGKGKIEKYGDEFLDLCLKLIPDGVREENEEIQ